MQSKIEAILTGRGYPDDIVRETVRSYEELKRNYYLRKFKPSELEGGFFVEAVRRILEFELHKKYVSTSQKLPPLNDGAMQHYEQGTGDEAFRLHIPRVLRSIYNLRNNRGVGHVGQVQPNVMDSTYIMSAVDWVMAELIRQTSTLPPDECQATVDALVQRRLPLVFEDGDVRRVLDPKMPTRKQILVLLYHESGPVSEKDLQAWTEYGNTTRFRKILRHLHKERLIEYRDGVCKITPRGIQAMEA
ncbi:MAG: hypothetical protein ACM3XZ_00840 [Betaproteobacteria bacterium]